MLNVWCVMWYLYLDSIFINLKCECMCVFGLKFNVIVVYLFV